MALNKNHQVHLDTMAAFEAADKNTPRLVGAKTTYGMGANGMPRTPAQQAAVKKAAEASAIARKGRAVGATAAPAPLGTAPKVKVPTPGIGAGSLSIAAPRGLKPKKGLLSL
jgi:hypothetical protein